MTPDCEHNCIPCRKWWRSGWVCVRCGRWFRVEPRRESFQAFCEATPHVDEPLVMSEVYEGTTERKIRPRRLMRAYWRWLNSDEWRSYRDAGL
jgi:hypothetical protein